jgi:hypothetical protein
LKKNKTNIFSKKKFKKDIYFSIQIYNSKKNTKIFFIYKAKFTFCIFLLKFIIEKNEIKNLSKSISEKILSQIHFLNFSN